MIELPLLGHDAPQDAPAAPRVWRSPAQRSRPEAVAAQHGAEFMPEALEAPSGANRRQFLQLMGAGAALMGLSACRKPAELILPYSRKPEDVIEGIAQYYATAMPLRGVVSGLLAESHEGRPTKVEGNPEHPAAQGVAGLWEQASILNLYDPDRSRRVRQGTSASTWRAFLNAASRFTGTTVVVAEPSSSPTRARVQAALAGRFPGLRWMTYRPEGDHGFALATQAATGRAMRPVYDFAAADVVVFLDADVLSPTEVGSDAHARSFSEARRPERGTMPRVYAVESSFTPTGGQADHRLRLKPSRIVAFAQALAGRTGAAAAGFTGREAAFLDALAADVQGKRVLVVAGASMPAAVHGLAMQMTNAGLGMIDGGAAEPSQAEGLRALVAAMGAGQVQNVVFLGTNPVYDAPAELRFAEALKRVPNSVHVGTHLDETAQACAWHVPMAHYLEAWGDGRAYDGTLSVIQPLIAPLNGKNATATAQTGEAAHEADAAAVPTADEVPTEADDIRSDIELLNALATGTLVSGYDLVRETWRGSVAGDFEQGWRKAVHDGFAANSAAAVGAARAGAAVPALPALPAASGDQVEVQVRLSPTLLDGTFSNNPWMQELPDPVTKLVWDNVAQMSRATAEGLGLACEYENGRYRADVVRLSVGDRSVTLPVWITPGHADGAVTVTMGYGRSLATARPEEHNGFFDTRDRSDVYLGGPLANGVGTNVGPLRGADYAPWLVASVAKTGDVYTLVSTQEHGGMDNLDGSVQGGRAILLEGTLEEYKAHPSFARDLQPHVPGVPGGSWEAEQPLWDDAQPQKQDYMHASTHARHQWGMVVDLTSCTGCAACVVACNAENNISTVGKDQVGKGREMHWLRIDRYYIGEDEADPRMGFQFLTCVHCENAPCESVCPVAATVHSDDGTNQMIYNRCIGTRYCSNNCPYKVRRYNWYYWSKHLPLTVQMQQNPNVTVRSRGVMEKCSFCIQRVREANNRASLEGRAIADGEVQTACQTACAPGAITFGDIADPNTAVSKMRANPRRYELLPELGTRPRLSYLSRVRNPNPALEPPRPATAHHGGGPEGANPGHQGGGGPQTQSLADSLAPAADPTATPAAH